MSESVSCVTISQGFFDYDRSKDVRDEVCLKLKELLANGHEIISVSESFQPGSFDNGNAILMCVAIYYRGK